MVAREEENGEEFEALENKPYLGDDPDLQKLLSNFWTLCQTRQPGFSGPGALRLSDMMTLYQVEGWTEAGMEPEEFVHRMLFLDSIFLRWHADRRPTGK